MNRRTFLGAGLAAGWAVARPQGSPAPRLRLNSNENPRGLSQACREAVAQAIPEAGRYPFPHAERLRQAVAEWMKVEPSSVVMGNGSSEVIQMAVQALAPAGSRLVMANPTFDNVEGYARSGVEIIKVPLAPDYGHDLEAMKKACQGAEQVLVYICNPNNPTATLTPSREIDEWIGEAPASISFLVDEAYFDYVQDPAYHSEITWAKRRANVVVTRTFSKVYGMAGLRLGYGLCHPRTAAKLRRWAADVNLNYMAIVAGLQALKDQAYRDSSLSLNQESKRLLETALKRLGIAYLPSHTNFMMYRIQGDLNRHIERMRQRNVLVGRRFPPLLQFNRVTLGLPQEMERFAQVLQEFRDRGWV